MIDEDETWQDFKAHTEPLKKRHIQHESNTYKPPQPLPHTCPMPTRPPEEALMADKSKPHVLSPKNRRKLMPEKSIDLHGMTKDQAYENLVRFIRFSVEVDRRVVLVITGKGRVTKTSDLTPVTLRDSLPHWLKAPPLNQWVHSFSQARSEHGGDGSFYLTLRKRGQMGP